MEKEAFQGFWNVQKPQGKHFKILNVCPRSKIVTNSLCYSPNQNGCRDKQVGDVHTLNTRDRRNERAGKIPSHAE